MGGLLCKRVLVKAFSVFTKSVALLTTSARFWSLPMSKSATKHSSKQQRLYVSLVLHTGDLILLTLPSTQLKLEKFLPRRWILFSALATSGVI